MKLNINSLSLCRTPIFSYQSNIEDVWQPLKSYIEESSPSFYEIIKDYQPHDLHTMEPKARFTLWKYFNRAKFRATPYGNFAAFTLIPVSIGDPVNGVTVTEKSSVHRFADWSDKEKINLDPLWLSRKSNSLRANTSTYICGDQLRYVNIVNGVFELSEVAIQDLAMDTLKFCQTKRTLNEVTAFLKSRKELKKEMIKYFLEQLISLQLLLTDYHPNITGTDYFNRVAHNVPSQKTDYIIAERTLVTGHLNQKSLQVLIELTNFLSKNVPSSKNRSLVDYQNRFYNKFEGTEVPLLVALDPETGINYISLEQEKDEDSLVQELKKNKEPTAISLPPLSALQKFILDQMIQQKAVQLTEFNESEIPATRPIANTISILFHYSDELIIAEQFGGSTANTLLGRFTMASDEVTGLTKKMVTTEQNANPDILFFDIAYQAEKHVDNVNRRKSIYDYELPILTWTESDHILDLNDITIAVINGELVLRSIKYGKRIIPKLASAYNYTRSDLTIFRFLSDLQYQNLHHSLSVNMDQVFPGLIFYPRITYKNVILSPAKWRVPDQLCIYKSLPLVALKEWIANIDLPEHFKCGVGDQTLCFNKSIEEDLNAFLSYSKNKTSLYIEEAFIPKAPVIKDEQHSPYLSEFIINLEHNEQLYKPYPAKLKSDINHDVTKYYLPGSEWLYFEIYCHSARSNIILTGIIKAFLLTIKKSVRKWFFIRYTNPSHHIRLRLQLKPGTDGYQIITAFSNLLETHISSGIVSDLQIKTYRRETERYGNNRIHLVEKCFAINSDFILDILKNEYQINYHYAMSISMIENVMNEDGFSTQEQLVFAENLADRFASEMNIETDGFKKINQSFKDFTQYGNIKFLNIRQNKKLVKVEKSFLVVLKTCNADEKISLLADLFHMHVNRLFNNDQRMHEMIIYHYLARALKIRAGRQKKQEKLD